MMSKTVGLALLLAFAEARFGQEQVPVAAIQALSNFGKPGDAATLAGAVPGSLLAGANACAQVSLADKIVTTLGNDPQVIAAAAKLVAAEKNFNPFAVSIPSVCNDKTLPATAALQGIVPLVDPSVVGADVQNKNSAASLTKPFSANGLSIADVSIAQGFSNFTAQAADGTNTAASGASGAKTGGASGAKTGGANNGTASTGAATNAKGGADTKGNGGAASKCGSGAKAGGAAKSGNGAKTGGAAESGDKSGDAAKAGGAANANATAAATGNSASANTAAGNAGAGTNAAAGTKSSDSALDFGTCNPAMSFVAGRPGRKATEFTFNSVDARILSIQQEALNPNIITNRICDEVQNRCNANQAAIQACLTQKAALLAKDINTVKVAATATNWNTALGFANVNISSITG